MQTEDILFHIEENGTQHFYNLRFFEENGMSVLYVDIDHKPFLYQPGDPTQSKLWENFEEAKQWFLDNYMQNGIIDETQQTTIQG